MWRVLLLVPRTFQQQHYCACRLEQRGPLAQQGQALRACHGACCLCQILASLLGGAVPAAHMTVDCHNMLAARE